MKIPFLLKFKKIYLEDFIELWPILYLWDAKKDFRLNLWYYQSFYDMETTAERYWYLHFDKNFNILEADVFSNIRWYADKKKWKEYRSYINQIKKQWKIEFKKKENEKLLKAKIKEYHYRADEIDLIK